MHKVSKETFYKTIHDRKLDVIPSPQIVRDENGRCVGMKSVWKMRNGSFFGTSVTSYIGNLDTEYSIT